MPHLPDPAAVRPDTPLLLDVAAALAFPDRSMTGSRLRREIARGRLEGWKAGGKIYTTLAAIEAMWDRCRLPSEASAQEGPSALRSSKSEAGDAGELALARLKATIAANRSRQ
jgi:hypothetical protein